PQPVRASRAGDLAVLFVAVAVTIAVGAAAGFISFRHFVALALSLGEPFEQAILYPAAAEGLVIMAGLVMLYCSRRTLPVPWLAWVSMAFGILVALTVNVVHGYARSIGAALLAALAPIAFVASYELLMRLIRLVRLAATAPTQQPEQHASSPDVVKVPVTIRRVVKVPVETVIEKPVEVEVERVVEKHVPVTIEKLVEVPTPVVPVDALDAARIAYEHSLTTPGRRLGQRTLATRFNIQPRAAEELIKASQETTADGTAEQPEQAPAVTAQEPPAETPADRHSTATETPAEHAPDTDLDEESVTLLRALLNGRRDRHSDPLDDVLDAPTAGGGNAVSPAAVTIADSAETAADDRHSTPAGESAEPVSEEAVDEPPVTVPDGAAVPSQRQPWPHLAAVFQEPDELVIYEEPVTLPDEPARPSQPLPMTSFDRAIVAAIAEQQLAHNGAGATVTDND
ncbi:DUF2637 domain-containing protein, partial [Nonomuraea sp. NN258]|uniref:DUF2637 domain-containing protein n=1 Tax=Nonomuraea antri TaxID=2730852 RepID=UPI00156A4D3F